MSIATRSEVGPCLSNKISCTIPIDPLTSPALVHIFAVNMTRELFASNNWTSRPFVTSELVRLASCPPVCTALILATGWFKSLSNSTLTLSTSIHFVNMNATSENRSSSTLFKFPSNLVVSCFQSSRLFFPLRSPKKISLKCCCSLESPDCH
ncbi:hypothetical protein RclHR1_15480003 [Rhizophagus clarus]|uniref:Uncharacterized protein n=1 Tax=Rhizophagus clarus TaxID=94130 RepID=A0A2Z6QUC0_9GLOM|nr:hypothetical protein RclHR1_15480003 [Rhizophagus clarus]GES89427.1 hypothetical protein RCL_jg595.t1 [Rhizophagus clarus]